MNFKFLNMNSTSILNKLKTALFLGLVMMFFNCSNDNLPTGQGVLRISAKSNSGTTAAKSSKKLVSNVEITKLLLNVKEFELELDIEDPNEDLTQNSEDWDDDGTYDFQDEIELEGPYELDLLSGQVNLLNVTVPTGKYEELEFKFGPNQDPNSTLFGKSIIIEGTVSGTPFTYSHNFTEEFEVDFEDTAFDILISEAGNGIVINFDLNQLFDITTGVDLSQATDGNNNGTIEIDHNDTDGNGAIADAIKNKIKDTLDLLDD